MSGRHPMALGIACTLIGGALWGVSGTSVQYLTTTGGAAPALVTFMRVLLGGAIFFSVLCAAKKVPVKAMFANVSSLGALLLFAFSLYANQLCYAQTVQITNAGTATVLQMLGSVFVLAYVCIANKRLPRPWELIGLALALVATVLIATQGDLTSLNMPLDGLLWGIATGLSTALYIVVPQRMHLFERFGSAPVVAAGMLLSSIFALPIYAVQAGGFADAVATLGGFTLFQWGVFMVGLVLVGTIGGYGLYLHGVSIVGSVRGTLLGAIEPVSATIMSAAFLGTAFTGWDLSGTALMCLMLVFLSKEP
ncbi:MAG: EamA family transporter [Eggerthellaceae bacterium]|nr:EamA family transporter [Eggerthellaceae bacterium]